jgi:FlaG/FlaF family flagellin (archaellin)
MMQRDDLAADRRGATSVVGVVLIVSLTVLLAATVVVYTGSLAESLQEPQPTISATADQTTATITAHSVSGGPKPFEIVEYRISYQTGETLDKQNIRVTVNGNQALGYARPAIRGVDRPTYLLTGDGTVQAGSQLTVVAYWDDDTLVDSFETGRTGDRYEVMADGSLGVFDMSAVGTHRGRTHDVAPLDRGDIVRIMWVSDDGESSTVLFEGEVA